MPTAHAKLSASSAHRWVRCPASIQMCEGLEQEDSPFALEGTCAHELAERALVSGGDCADFVGLGSTDAEGYTFTDEMADYCQQYVDFVRSFEGDRYIEERVSYEHITPGGFGTADAIIVGERELHVIDLKYGTGVRVNAQDNYQLLLYASGALAAFDPYGEIDVITVHIVQPRLDHIDSWTFSVRELDAFELIAREAAQSALSDDPRFGPGEGACRWCLAKDNCQSLASYNKQTVLKVFSEPEGAFKDAHGLSADDLAWALRRSKALTDWVGALQKAATERALAGEQVPGFKVVEGRSLRKWVDARDAEQVLKEELGEDAYKPKEIISVAQAEKALGKKHPIFATEVDKPPGKPTLVPESDKRQPMHVSASDAFND